MTGIPARYTNFHSANDETMQKIVLENEGVTKRDNSSTSAVRHGGLSGLFKKR